MSKIKQSGREIIKKKLGDLPSSPGIYQMFDENNNIIYIGKAKNLKKRVSNYTKNDLPTRTSRMVFLTCVLEYITTKSEAEALLLEAQLIKKHQPKFNILLKDDKSFPYIKLRLDHEYPQIVKYRGRNLTGGKFFGPFASSYQVEITLAELQKIFKLRPCSDNYFNNRKRPCLQYQIKRCYAPCTAKITKEDYKDLVEQVEAFLTGKNQQLQELLAKKMAEYSQTMQYEKAAEIRDRIKSLSYIQLKSGIGNINIKDADVIAIAENNGQFCVQVFLYRASHNYGGKSYFPVHAENYSTAEVLESFIGQFYQTRPAPEEIIINHPIEETSTLEEALKKLHGLKTTITLPQRGAKYELITHALEQANNALKEKAHENIKKQAILEEVQKLFELEDIPNRIEIYDNSHIMGKYAVGAMVVATPCGFDRSEYRRFTIKNINLAKLGGDDFAMLEEVITRRITRLIREPDKKPNLMIIDGGKGHMNIVMKVMHKLNYFLPFVCMSKGPNRNAGEEQFHIPGRESFTLDKTTRLMKYLQTLRDEAHNYAIRSHRIKRSKAIKISSLDQIPSIGEARKSALLNYFGSFQAISDASMDELSKAHGISKTVARKIFETLHPLEN